jgi:hypothetical protein
MAFLSRDAVRVSAASSFNSQYPWYVGAQNLERAGKVAAPEIKQHMNNILRDGFTVIHGGLSHDIAMKWCRGFCCSNKQANHYLGGLELRMITIHAS